MINEAAREVRHLSCPKVQVTTNNSLRLIPHLSRRSGPPRKRLRASLDALENINQI